MSRSVMILKGDCAEQWAERITVQLGKTVEAIIEVGHLLIKAKADMQHGEFTRLFQDQLVPFGHVTATRFMAIASHPILANIAQGPCLPPNWRTLYELTKADRGKLQAAIKAGLITPDLTRRELKALLPPAPRRTKRITTATPTASRTPSGRLYFQISRLMSDEFDALALEDQDDLLGMLDQLLAKLRESRQGKESV